jgi:hypothetical protein
MIVYSLWHQGLWNLRQMLRETRTTVVSATSVFPVEIPHHMVLNYATALQAVQTSLAISFVESISAVQP